MTELVLEKSDKIFNMSLEPKKLTKIGIITSILYDTKIGRANKSKILVFLKYVYIKTNEHTNTLLVKNILL